MSAFLWCSDIYLSFLSFFSLTEFWLFASQRLSSLLERLVFAFYRCLRSVGVLRPRPSLAAMAIVWSFLIGCGIFRRSDDVLCFLPSA